MKGAGRARRASARPLLAVVALLAAAPLAASAVRAADGVEDLASSNPALRARAFAFLRLSGASSVDRALDGFGDAPPIARELRARLVRELGAAEHLEAVGPLLADSDTLVRQELTEFLARTDLGSTRADLRGRLLLERARDADASIRQTALDALARIADRSLLPGLADLVRRGDAAQRLGALRALATAPGAAPVLLDLAERVSAATPSERGAWLVALGSTGDGTVLRELVRWAQDPADGAAARTGFELLTRQLLYRRLDAEYLAALDAWRVVSELDALRRRARFELLVRNDMEALRTASHEIDRLAAARGAEFREVRAAARTQRAIADIADGRGADAEAAIRSALAFVARRRGDATPVPRGEDTLVDLAGLRMLSALNAVLNPFEGAPAPEERVVQAYDLQTERLWRGVERSAGRLIQTSPALLARIFEGRGAPLFAPWGFDTALEPELGVLTVVGTVLPRRGRGAEGLRAGRRLLEILARVNPHEFVVAGAEPGASGTRNPFESLLFLQLPGCSLSPVRVELAVPVSRFPRQLGLVAREALGDHEAAAELLEPVIDRAARGEKTNDLVTFVEASLERAGVAMDAHDADAADAYVDRVLDRLELVRAQYEDEFDPALVRDLGGAQAAARTLEARTWLDLARRLRSQALITKAVNHNVVRGEPKRASAFAKEGVELEPSDFNRVLLSCYLAREGNGDEARRLLRDLQEAPSAYYNLACTYALLGEADTALRYLERDFRENRTDPGGLERQRAWARKDPDLASLRDDPRFRDLVGP